MPTSTRQCNVSYLQDISANSYCCMRADVGIGPYNDLLDKSEFDTLICKKAKLVSAWLFIYSGFCLIFA